MRSIHFLRRQAIEVETDPSVAHGPAAAAEKDDVTAYDQSLPVPWDWWTETRATN